MGDESVGPERQQQLEQLETLFTRPGSIDLSAVAVGMDPGQMLKDIDTLASASRITPSRPKDADEIYLRALWDVRSRVLEANLGPAAEPRWVSEIRGHFESKGDTALPREAWSTDTGTDSAQFVLSAPTADIAAVRADALGHVDRLMNADDPYDWNWQEGDPYKTLMSSLPPRIETAVGPLINHPLTAVDYTAALSSEMLDLLLETGRQSLEWELFTLREWPWGTSSPTHPMDESYKQILRDGWEGWGRNIFRLAMQVKILLSELRVLMTGDSSVMAQLHLQVQERYESAAANAHEVSGAVFDRGEHVERDFVSYTLRELVGSGDPLYTKLIRMNLESLKVEAQKLDFDPANPSRPQIARYRLLADAGATLARLNEEHGTDPATWPSDALTLHQTAGMTMSEVASSATDERVLELADQFQTDLS